MLMAAERNGVSCAGAIATVGRGDDRGDGGSSDDASRGGWWWWWWWDPGLLEDGTTNQLRVSVGGWSLGNGLGLGSGAAPCLRELEPRVGKASAILGNRATTVQTQCRHRPVLVQQTTSFMIHHI
jgi:hypothetical protein